MSNKQLDNRAKQVHRYKLLGHTNKEIAEMMGISVRTVSRALKRDLEESGEEDLAILDPSLRDEYLSRARPILLGTLDDLEIRRLEGKLSNRDLILLAQSTFTNIARLNPVEEKGEPEGEPTTFMFKVPDQVIEGEVIDGDEESE